MFAVVPVWTNTVQGGVALNDSDVDCHSSFPILLTFINACILYLHYGWA